jgi:hypothetical protein
MNNLTNFYKNKSEVLAEQIKILENQLKHLEENAPSSVFKAGAKGQPAFSDDQLRDQMRQHKKSSIFTTYKDEDQSTEYRDAQAELARREAAKNAPPKPQGKPTSELMAANKDQRMKDLATEPSQKVSKAVVAKQNKPKTDTSYDAAEAARSRRSAETKPARQMAATPTLLQRDPNVPTPPAKGEPAPVAGGTKPKPTTVGPNSDFATQQRAAGVSDMVKDALNKSKSSPSPDTSFNTSLFGSGQQQITAKPSYNFQQSSKQISDMTSGLLNRMGNSSSQQKPQTPAAPAAGTQTGRAPVQATSNPNVSTFKASGFIDKPTAQPGLGKIQLDPADLTEPKRAEWAKKQLEAEVGAKPTVKPPNERPRTPGFFENLGQELSFAKNVVSNIGKGVGERIGELMTGKGNIIPDSKEDTQIGYGSALMPKGDKPASRMADYVDAIADAGSPADGMGLARTLMRAGANRIRNAEATSPNPNAQAALQKYREEEKAMLARGINKPAGIK